jgi:hypothetical protein
MINEKGALKILPDGFTDLVSLSLEQWDWDILPENDEDVWDSLMSQIFLGATVRSAQAKYVKEVLEQFISHDVAWEVDTNDWSSRVLDRIRKEKAKIPNTPGESYKSAILNLVEQDVADLSVSRTIYDALNFFNNYNICTAEIIRIENDTKETKDLVDLISREIHNVSYVKAVLWLYSCGIAREVVPPNAHVINFLRQYGYLSSAWTRYDQPPDWQIFSVLCEKMCDVSQQVSIELGEQVTPKQAQSGVWYLQTCKGLLSSWYSGRLTPSKLIDFMKYQDWDIGDLAEAILDVEQLEDFEEDLKAFIKIS